MVSPERIDYGPLMDEGMTEWCDRLNAIPGVQTWQSCTGHPANERSKTGDSGYQRSGNLWFTADHFTDEKAWTLSEQPTIEQVAHLFGRERFPVWEIIFQGRNRGERYFEASMAAILAALSYAQRTSG